MQSRLSFPSFAVAHPPHKHPPAQGGPEKVFHLPPSSALATFLDKPSSLLSDAFLMEAVELTPKTEFYGREGSNNNWAMRDL